MVKKLYFELKHQHQTLWLVLVAYKWCVKIIVNLINIRRDKGVVYLCHFTTKVISWQCLVLAKNNLNQSTLSLIPLKWLLIHYQTFGRFNKASVLAKTECFGESCKKRAKKCIFLEIYRVFWIIIRSGCSTGIWEEKLSSDNRYNKWPLKKNSQIKNLQLIFNKVRTEYVFVFSQKRISL